MLNFKVLRKGDGTGFLDALILRDMTILLS